MQAKQGECGMFMARMLMTVMPALVTAALLAALCLGQPATGPTETVGTGVAGVPQVTGLAAKYPGDAGIQKDPAVVFAEDFEETMAEVFARWNGQTSEAVTRSPVVPPASAGRSSARIKAVGSSGTLYKPLANNYDQLYFRYYAKFGGNGFHHAGGYIGGYHPLTTWPQGDAGIKGKRTNGDRLFVVGFEERDGRFLDFYNNWIDMPGPAWQGQYYGRSMLKSESIPLVPDRWYCAEIMVKVNSAPDVKDGELALWLDGKQVVHFRPGGPEGSWEALGGWRTIPGSAPFEGLLWRDTLDYAINWIKIQNYDAKPDVWFDDIVLATEYIGPIAPRR